MPVASLLIIVALAVVILSPILMERVGKGIRVSQFHIRALMIVVAAAALLLGVGIQVARIGALGTLIFSAMVLFAGWKLIASLWVIMRYWSGGRVEPSPDRPRNARRRSRTQSRVPAHERPVTVKRTNAPAGSILPYVHRSRILENPQAHE